MGDLAEKMLSNVLEQKVEQRTPDEIDEPWLGFIFSVEADAGFLGRHDQEMRRLVDARNDLIHHFLPRWEAAIDGDVDGALAYLDAQMHDALFLKDRLKSWALNMNEARRKIVEYVSSPEGARHVELSFLQNSRLVAMLGEIAMRTARPDGWAMLSTAGNLIKREAPDELENLKERFGHRNLKGVLLAAEFFDVAEEQSPRGGVRTIYRINERYQLTRLIGSAPAG